MLAMPQKGAWRFKKLYVFPSRPDAGVILKRRTRCATSVEALLFGLGAASVSILFAIQSSSPRAQGPGTHGRMTQGRYPTGSPEMRLFEQVWTLRVEPR